MATGRRRQQGEAQAALLALSVVVVLLLAGLAIGLFLFSGGNPDGTGLPAAANRPATEGDVDPTGTSAPESPVQTSGTEPGAEVDRQSQEGPVEVGGRTLFLIEGHVRALESGAPAYGCEVYVIRESEGDPLQALAAHPLHRVMDPEGWFQVSVHDPGSYHLVVRSHDHQDLVRRILVPVTAPLDLRLARGAWMNGWVLGPQGQPAPGMTVWLHRQRMIPKGSLESLGRTTSDEEGRFAFYRLEPGTYRLGAGNPTAPLVIQEDLQLERDQQLEPILTLPPTSTLIVHVTGDDTNLLADARVTLTNIQGDVVCTAFTDPDGACRLGPVQEGPHRLTIRADGHSTIEEELFLSTRTDEITVRRRLRR